MEYVSGIVIDTGCLRGRDTCYHTVREGYKESVLSFQQIPCDLAPHKNLYDKTDDLKKYKLTNGDVVGISTECIETYPCEHSVTLNGETVGWGSVEIAAYFVLHNDGIVPDHFTSYLRGRDDDNDY